MYKICVFAGTTEGRELIEFLSSQPVAVTACVATEYGEALLPNAQNLTVLAGRLPEEEIASLLSRERFDLVIDATHPYAAAATEGIYAACQTTQTGYVRLLRSGSQHCGDAVYVEDMAQAIAFLQNTTGNILLTTGSKELENTPGLAPLAERIYARVLPLPQALQACRSAGLKESHIIAMQGPFSAEMNLAMLRFVSAGWLVTKDGGNVGGFAEKADAARRAGARLVVIGRPPQHSGLSFAHVVQLLCAKFDCTSRPTVHIVGIGPGSRAAASGEVLHCLQTADCLIGAKRMLQTAAQPGQSLFEAVAPAAIADYIFAHPQHRRFAVVMSGDTGFFSGTKKLLPLLQGCDVTVLPGISSLAYLCARLQMSYEDVFVATLHGRSHNIVPDVRAHSRTFVLCGGQNTIGSLCRSLEASGLGDVAVTVGERLSYPDEKLTHGTAAQLAEGSFADLSVALIENSCPDAVVTPGLPDELFVRGAGQKGPVPMTKSEVRAVCLAKLQLTSNALCWDIGAGTGSVAVEMALLANRGQVFAIEQNSEAAALLQTNKEQFGTENLTIVTGSAPEVCEPLPAPTHAFVGGSSGSLRGIIKQLLHKNPRVRIVATAISLESIGQLTECVKEFAFAEAEVVSLQVARSKTAGSYHLMTGQNPIYIFTLQGGGNNE